MARFIYCVAIGVAALLQPVQARNDVLRVADEETNDISSFESLFASVFNKSELASSGPTVTPTLNPLNGTPLPKICKDAFNNGRPLPNLCIDWLGANKDFIMPTHSPSEAPSKAPSQFFKVESTTSIGDDNRVSLIMDIGVVDDTFIELFRPDTPLGNKPNVKIDAIAGVPTKVAMLKFSIGNAMNQILSLSQKVEVTLESAKLQLFASATGALNQFGGYVAEMDTAWSEEAAKWKDYVKGGPGSKDDAMKLLPGFDTLSTFEEVSPMEWAEVDLTERFQKIVADWNNNTVPQFAVRITTDSDKGVVYSSKEDTQFAPKLSLVFVFEGTPADVAAAAVAAADAVESNQDDLLNATATLNPSPLAAENPTKAPTLVLSPPPTTLSSSSPTPNPTVATPLTTTNPTESPVVPTYSPTYTPSQNPVVATASPVVATPLPSTAHSTLSPTSTVEASVQDEASSVAEFTETSVATPMFQLVVVATTEDVRKRNLRATRELNPFMSLDEKERPALIRHLMDVYNETLSSSPERVEITFANEDEFDAVVVSSNDVVRTSEFKVIAIFNDPRIQSITANEASAVLEEATLHAFIGAQNDDFVSILKGTGDPIIDISEKIKVAVSKISNSEIMSENTAQAATATGESVGAGNIEWAGPALAIGASLVVIASALASFILIKQRRNHFSYDEEHKHSNDHMSPTNTVPMTPSPTWLADVLRKKTFDYAEFEDDVEEEPATTPPQYDLRPLSAQELSRRSGFDCPPDIKVPQFQCTSFDESDVSDVSAFIYNTMTRSPMAKSPINRNKNSADFERPDMSALEQVKSDNDLEDSASQGNVPSELYSNLSMDDSFAMESHDMSAVYGANTFLLEKMIKSNEAAFSDMPPPPSDAASENSSQQGGKEQQLEGMFPSDPFYNDEGATIEGSGESYQKAITDELTKVMKILNYGDVTDDDKMERDGDDSTEDLGSIGNEDVSDVTPSSNGYDVQSKDDPVKLMKSALDDCMAILEKARPNNSSDA